MNNALLAYKDENYLSSLKENAKPTEKTIVEDAWMSTDCMETSASFT